MTTLQATPAAPTRDEADQRVLLTDVSWDAYRTIGDLLADRPALRLTYDQGILEIMVTSPRHEVDKKWLACFIQILAEESQREFTTAGNMTFQREDLQKGMEPDDCFWISNEPQMRGKRTWQPDVDPPPDLALEIEVSRSAVSRMNIYAALRVSEIWRFNGVAIRCMLLGPEGVYQQAEKSLSFPEITVGDLMAFLKQSESSPSLTVIRDFRAWVRKQVHSATQAKDAP